MKLTGIGFLLFFIFFVFPIGAEPAVIDEPVLDSNEEITNYEITLDEPIQNEYENEVIANAEPIDDDFDLNDDSFFFEAPPIIIEAPPFLGTRSFNDIFPNLTRMQRAAVNSSVGLRYTFQKAENPILKPAADSGIELLGSVMSKNPSHIVEALILLPYNRGRELDMLDIYNALGRIKNIKDYPFFHNGRNIFIFTDSTRLESARNRMPIPDPLPAEFIPYSDTMFLRFTDAGIGDVFIRGDISASLYGITYNLTNFRDVRYSFIPIIRAERVSVIIYLEPVKEGILVYNMSGFFLPGLVANSANLPININARITTLLNWITDSLRMQ